MFRSIGGWLFVVTVGALSCGDSDDGAPTAPRIPEVQLVSVSGSGQEIFSGRRSDDPFVVRVVNRNGEPLEGETVLFSLTGVGSGVLSQKEALSDGNGFAETYLLEATPGDGIIRASVTASSITFDFLVRRAPGEIKILPGTGDVGLPGQLHPDSIIQAQVFDTEGAPMAGVQVFFIAPGTLSTVADTTDAEGIATTTLRETRLEVRDQTVIAFILGFPSVFGIGERKLTSVAQRTVLITVDGLRGDAIADFAPPTLTRMVEEGAFTPNGKTIQPSFTIPAHLSLFASTRPEGHGLFTDELRFTSEMASLDPVFKSARRRGETAIAFMSEEGPLENFRDILNCRLAFGLDSLFIVPASAAEVVDEATPELENSQTELIFLHLPDPDIAGHEFGWSSPEYRDAVFRADDAIARVIDAVDESTLIFVTSDHGGGGAFGDFQHGSASPEDNDIPILFYGPNVRRSVNLGQPSILDIAPTILWSLGLAPPRDYEGRILLEGFELDG